MLRLFAKYRFVTVENHLDAINVINNHRANIALAIIDLRLKDPKTGAHAYLGENIVKHVRGALGSPYSLAGNPPMILYTIHSQSDLPAIATAISNCIKCGAVVIDR